MKDLHLLTSLIEIVMGEGGVILVYVKENIPSNLIETNSLVESISIELNLRKKKWLVNCSYNANNSNIVII